MLDTPEVATFKVLGEALAIGLLVGAERYRGRAPGEDRSAGVRTFAIFCILGAVCGLLDTTAFTTVTFAATAALVLVGYWRSPEVSLGMTTELAALLVFWIGFLLTRTEAAAVSLGVVLTIFLASKRTLHRFVRDQISEDEFEATLKFLAVVLVIYPILPDRGFGPWEFFNPRQVWGFVILVSTISYAGYFLVRWLGERRGLVLGSLLVEAASSGLGDRGILLASAVGGLGSTSAVALSVSGLLEQGSLSPLVATGSILAAITAAEAAGVEAVPPSILPIEM